ncbi:MAG: type I glyceraldehyde-3-phosphate dehydrogenase [Candidatus Nealsonbacteria bacterium RIFOXYB1_FULL_40_15]|uniref:Type I glyceraldehyde-3-phosphate dehydrogenase n=2 Tax=Candidatus Nealsoniibacteriota TaxID=1817911 RepID=A0A1G2ES62_9BACT|nr:MAG: type I glyceraldehyde-3-phosphate dehydrogenase [Candidatus Nealsonbacteria bacterium RIFOXYB1_FULL_40_15]OGZ28372.1 MAG: type I glyceraldehyde-3-phosphate dehydrogenase [Candidatus Nealsonbacteria bacterium RIFOXYC1_FULL_40_7]OGZ29497.1 MAG: type I glyceraldehyde-3-phosphate dehydrogenase [Candidatus Nealsonbacteria bacterium RIFOXYD1_FULL_39_11]
MSIKIGINGFGRIGRPAFRHILENPNLKLTGINDLTDTKTLAHLLKYDSNYGIYSREVSYDDQNLIVDGVKYRVFSEKDPEKIPWKADIILECTGIFRDRKGAGKHLNAGAKKVIISAPAKGDDIPTFILGVNESEYNAEKADIMDMGSCTTNCLAPVAKILNDNFEIIKGFMTTIHSYTNDQRILDLPHEDLRRARAAALNMIPTSTGAAKAIGKAIPSLNGKLDGIAVRVPTPIVSILDLIVELGRPVSKEEVNNAFKESEIEGIFRTEKQPLVSSDYKGNTYSSIIDLSETMVNGNLVKVLAWYDNEAGYSKRLVEFAEFIGKKLK